MDFHKLAEVPPIPALIEFKGILVKRRIADKRKLMTWERWDRLPAEIKWQVNDLRFTLFAKMSGFSHMGKIDYWMWHEVMMVSAEDYIRKLATDLHLDPKETAKISAWAYGENIQQ